jgi:hypothetical protein
MHGRQYAPKEKRRAVLALDQRNALCRPVAANVKRSLTFFFEQINYPSRLRVVH